MSSDSTSRPPSPRPDPGCSGFHSQLHFRHELQPADRLAFDRHAAACRACAEVLLETELLDDVLLQWQAPEAPGDPGGTAGAEGAGGSFHDKVMRAVSGEGPTASCAESTASLHHLIAGDLEPWIAARVERHLARCSDCADHLDEVRHSRRVWMLWKAPDPGASFADDLIKRLEPETRLARRRRQLLELVTGPVRVPRWAAAFVLASVTILSVGVLKMRDTPAGPDGSTANVIEHRTSAILPLTDRTRVPVTPAQYSRTAPAGRGDPTGSLSPDLRGGKNGSLRSTLRGE